MADNFLIFKKEFAFKCFGNIAQLGLKKNIDAEEHYKIPLYDLNVIQMTTKFK